MRTACLLVPDLPLRAELRTHPEWETRPLVVTSGTDSRALVIAASSTVRAAGVRPPCSLTHARAVYPNLFVRATSLDADQAARNALLDAALSCSPRALLAPLAAGSFLGEAAVFVDATGVRSLFHSEEGFAAALGARAARLGLPCIVTIASSRAIAHLVARASAARGGPSREGDVLVLPPDREREFLAPLSLDLLDPDDRLAQKLTRFGVHRIRDLLALPRRSLAQRMGPEALQLVARASGRETEPPIPAPEAAKTEESIDLDTPVDRIEALLFVLRGALSRILERLEVRGLACHALDLALILEGGATDERRIGVAAPTRDPRVLLRLLALSLEERPPEAPIDRLSLATEGIPLRGDQLDLFRPRGPDPAALDETLAELQSLCGADRVGSPQVADDHRPDAYAMKAFRLRAASPPHSDHAAARERVPASSAVRALRPPVAAQVRVERGHPAWIRSAVAQGEVVHAAGPWRTTGRWWSREERFAIDHYDVQVSDGTVIRLGFDYMCRRWHIDAIYD